MSLSETVKSIIIFVFKTYVMNEMFFSEIKNINNDSKEPVCLIRFTCHCDRTQ